MGLAASFVAAALLYLATRHQKLGRRWRPHAKALRGAGQAVFVASLVVASPAAGFWPALFTNLCMLMVGCVLLPLADAWRARRHVA